MALSTYLIAPVTTALALAIGGCTEAATEPSTESSCSGREVCPAGTAPALGSAGWSYTDPSFGTEVFRLTDESICAGGASNAYSYWSALNADNSILLAYCGSPTLFRIDWAVGSVHSLGAAFQSVQLYWEGFIWNRSNPAVGVGVLASTSQAQLIEYDVAAHTHRVIKHFQQDSRFTSLFGSSSAYLWQLSASEDQHRYAATVRSGSYQPLGLVVYDVTTDEVWAYTIPSGETLDEGQLDKTGRYLVIKLNGRKWQVWDLTQPSAGPVKTDGPGHSDNGASVLFQGHGRGLYQRELGTAENEGPLYAAPLVEGKSNGYADAHTSALAGDGYVYWSTYTSAEPGTGGPVSINWVSDGGETWRVDYNEEIAAKPYKRMPEVVRMGQHALRQVGSLPLARGDWHLTSAGVLYVRNPDGSDPNTRNMVAFDWRPIHEEVVGVRTDGTGLVRLAHHHAHIYNYNSTPRAAVSYDGGYVVFTSNWGGRSRNDVFAVRVP